MELEIRKNCHLTNVHFRPKDAPYKDAQFGRGGLFSIPAAHSPTQTGLFRAALLDLIDSAYDCA